MIPYYNCFIPTSCLSTGNESPSNMVQYVVVYGTTEFVQKGQAVYREYIKTLPVWNLLRKMAVFEMQRLGFQLLLNNLGTSQTKLLPWNWAWDVNSTVLWSTYTFGIRYSRLHFTSYHTFLGQRATSCARNCVQVASRSVRDPFCESAETFSLPEIHDTFRGQ